MHKCSAAEWQSLSTAQLSQKLPARPVKSSLSDPTNSFGSALKIMLDELTVLVRGKIVEDYGEGAYFPVRNSTEFLSKLEAVEVDGDTVLLTGDFK